MLFILRIKCIPATFVDVHYKVDNTLQSAKTRDHIIEILNNHTIAYGE